MIKELVNKSYNLAKEAHEGQVRKFTALPYFSHCKYVARIISDLTSNEFLISAALCHDVIEDTTVTEEELRSHLGDRVGDLVMELTSDKPKKISKRKYLTEKMNKMSQGALLIKLADRYHNVMFLQSDGVDRDFIEKYVLETKYIMENIGTHHFGTNHFYLRDIIVAEVEWLSFRYEIKE